MRHLEINGFVSFTLAIILLFIGKIALNRSATLRKYSIPEPVIGGFLAGLVVAVIYFTLSLEVTFQLQVQPFLLLYFFAGIGLKADIRDLLTGGKPLLFLTLLAAGYMLMQNLLGMGVAAAFGMDPKAGLMAGSVSLTGGLGTTVAWAPIFTERLGIANATEIGVASSTLGLIAACVVGGPIANYLINRHKLHTSGDADLDIGQPNAEQHIMVDSYGVLWAWLWLNIALIIGYFLDMGLDHVGVKVPRFVSCLLAGIVISNVGRRLLPKLKWTGEKQGLALISDIALGMFLVMALMSLKLWELKGAVAFLTVVIALQVLMVVVFALFVVFRVLGKDYEASVISAGFTGITLGTTATAIVSMTAVTKQYGAAHRAFLLVPLVGGFFIDIINALAINFFANL
ncbi:MAG: sodium/glutamate symporter [Terrimicrobiaceae bacterium]